jgi:effector-binding domain-containing protein
MLDQVHACLGRAGVKGGCNVMLDRDLPEADQIAVEAGVEVSDPFPASGMVVVSALPAGLAAETTHRGPYDVLEAAHWAVLRWCASQGREITGERWEVYGDWHEDPAQLQTRIFYGLQEARPIGKAGAAKMVAGARILRAVPRHTILATAMIRMSARRLSTTECLRGNASGPV